LLGPFVLATRRFELGYSLARVFQHGKERDESSPSQNQFMGVQKRLQGSFKLIYKDAPSETARAGYKIDLDEK
jgi:hypothetical protein